MEEAPGREEQAGGRKAGESKMIKALGTGVSHVLPGPALHPFLPSLGPRSSPSKRGWSIPDGSRCSRLQGDAFLCHQAFWRETQGNCVTNLSGGRTPNAFDLVPIMCQTFLHNFSFWNSGRKSSYHYPTLEVEALLVSTYLKILPRKKKIIIIKK